jgi:ABC-type branched-subunit amino acid transport system substrate-binding protein
MKAAGVNVLYTPSMDPQSYGRLLQAAQQQNWKPDIAYNGSAYTAYFGKLAPGTSGDGTLYAGNTAPFLEGAKSTYPSVQLLTEWMGKVKPGVAIDNYAASGWANAALFVQALKAAGQNPTQKSLLTALSGIHSFTADGFQSLADPGAKQPSQCYLVFRYSAATSSWSVYGTPDSSGFECTPGGYLTAKS